MSAILLTSLGCLGVLANLSLMIVIAVKQPLTRLKSSTQVEIMSMSTFYIDNNSVQMCLCNIFWLSYNANNVILGFKWIRLNFRREIQTFCVVTLPLNVSAVTKVD